MGKKKKTAAYSAREEKQAQKVLIWIGVVAVLIVVGLFVLLSTRG